MEHRRLVKALFASLVASISLTVVAASPASADNINWGARWINNHSNQCMGVAGGSSANGANVVQYPCNGHYDQGWLMPWLAGTSLPLPVGTHGLVHNIGAANRCLGTLNGGTGNSTHVVSKACNTANADEIWTIVNAGLYGYAGGYVLQNGKTANQRCLSVPGASTAVNQQLIIFDCNGYVDQVWWRGDGYPPTT